MNDCEKKKPHGFPISRKKFNREKLNQINKCKKDKKELNERISSLLDYIKNIQHGMHFIGVNEEPPICISRLDFMCHY